MRKKYDPMAFIPDVEVVAEEPKPPANEQTGAPVIVESTVPGKTQKIEPENSIPRVRS